jgi:oligoribonuclease NrnB/cAMP/cGMP phosphodiesterase (DHH superfamily)
MTGAVCFHHNDADGRASGAIARYALGPDLRLIESDYDEQPIPWDQIASTDQVYVLDFSFSLVDMQKLAAGRKLTWIDHHKSALAELGDASAAWPGIRDISEAACVLTWRYFFSDRPVPRAITLIGDRDIWRWAEVDTGAFTEGLHVRDTHAGNDALWVPLLEDDPDTLRSITVEGRRLREIRLAEIQKQIERLGYEVQFEGHRTLVINAPGNGDMGQRGRDLGYEIIYCYEDRLQLNQLTTVVTLFSRQVDVSVIARRYGGGGHAQAAGFSFSRGITPFPPDADVKW